MSSVAAPPAGPQISWTLEDLLQVLGKLPENDLLQFLKGTFPLDDIKDLDRPSLLELAFSLLDIWQQQTPDYLVKATSLLCRNSFEAFIRVFWEESPGAQPLLWNWHMRVFAQELSLVAEAIFKRLPRPHDLVCNVSPGTSKSSIWSILFPCWVWTRMPEARIITASHTDSLVTDLAAKARDIMKGLLYNTLFPEIQFTEVQDSKGHYRNSHGGERFTCTVGGKSPMGLHAHFIIVDDPTDPKKVLSEAERKTAADFLTKVIPSRRVRGAQGDICATMLVMQRLALGDPTDVMLETATHEGAMPLRHLCLPAEETEDISPSELRQYYQSFNEDGGQEAHGLMDPIRLNRITLREQRAVLGEWAYAGQYLQKPRPPSGGMFKASFFSRRETAAPYACRRIRYWDRAASSDTSACATAGVLMAYDGQKIYVEDVVYGRWEPDERNAVMLATAQKDRTRYGKYEPTIWVESEGGSAGRDAWLGIVRTLIGFHVKEDQVRGSKDTRAEPWSTQLAAGNVVIIDNGESKGLGRAGWDINGYIEDHLHFRPMPGKRLGREKDRIDASSGAFNLLVGLKRVNAPLRTFGLSQKKRSDRWLVVCCEDDLSTLEIKDNTSLVVRLLDPPPAPIITMGEDKPAQGHLSGDVDTTNQPRELQQKALWQPGRWQEKNLGVLELEFADLNPAELQEQWEQPLQPWGLPPSDLQLSRDQARRLWSFVLSAYDRPWQVLVLVDRGGEDTRALSLAMALADSLRLPYSAIYRPGTADEILEEEPPNTYIYDLVKLSRHTVVAA